MGELPADAPAFRDFRQGYEPLDAGPDEFAAFIQSEIARWSGVARAAGLRS